MFPKRVVVFVGFTVPPSTSPPSAACEYRRVRRVTTYMAVAVTTTAVHALFHADGQHPDHAKSLAGMQVLR